MRTTQGLSTWKRPLELRDIANRLDDAIAIEQASKERELGIGPSGIGWDEVLKENSMKTLREMQIKGLTPKHTEVIRRVAAYSEGPETEENFSWEAKGAKLVAEQQAQQAFEEKRQKELARGWTPPAPKKKKYKKGDIRASMKYLSTREL